MSERDANLCGMTYDWPGMEVRRYFEALPLSMLEGPEAADPRRLLPVLLGEGATLSPSYRRCLDTGDCWQWGWSVIAPLERQVHGFVLATPPSDGGSWPMLSAEKRRDLLRDGVNRFVCSTEDVPSMVLGLAEPGTEPGTFDEWFRFDPSGVLNGQALPWVMTHALALLDEAETEAVEVLWALRGDADQYRRLRRVLDSVRLVSVNWERRAEADAWFARAVERVGGVNVGEAQMERVARLLLCTPYEDWEDEAVRLVRAASAGGEEDLGRRFGALPN